MANTYYSTFRIKLNPSKNLTKKLNNYFGINRYIYNRLVYLYNSNQIVLINTINDIIFGLQQYKGNKTSERIIKSKLYKNVSKILLIDKKIRKMINKIPMSMVRETTNIFIDTVIKKLSKDISSPKINKSLSLNHIGFSFLSRLSNDYKKLTSLKKKRYKKEKKLEAVLNNNIHLLDKHDKEIYKITGHDKYIEKLENDIKKIKRETIDTYERINKIKNTIIDYNRKNKLDYMEKRRTNFIRVYYQHNKYKYKKGNKTIYIPKLGRINIGNNEIDGKISYVTIYKNKKNEHFISIQTTKETKHKPKKDKLLITITDRKVILSDGKIFYSTDKMNGNWYSINKLQNLMDNNPDNKSKYNEEYTSRLKKHKRSLYGIAKQIAAHSCKNYNNIHIITVYKPVLKDIDKPKGYVEVKDPYLMDFGKEIERILIKNIERQSTKYKNEVRVYKEGYIDNIESVLNSCCNDPYLLERLPDGKYYCTKCHTIYHVKRFEEIKVVLLYELIFGDSYIQNRLSRKLDSGQNIIFAESQGQLNDELIEDIVNEKERKFIRITDEDLLRTYSNISEVPVHLKSRYNIAKMKSVQSDIHNFASKLLKKKSVRRKFGIFWNV